MMLGESHIDNVSFVLESFFDIRPNKVAIAFYTIDLPDDIIAFLDRKVSHLGP